MYGGSSTNVNFSYHRANFLSTPPPHGAPTVFLALRDGNSGSDFEWPTCFYPTGVCAVLHLWVWLEPDPNNVRFGREFYLAPASGSDTWSSLHNLAWSDQWPSPFLLLRTTEPTAPHMYLTRRCSAPTQLPIPTLAASHNYSRDGNSGTGTRYPSGTRPDGYGDDFLPAGGTHIRPKSRRVFFSTRG
jgi:hypothetical protein